MCKCCSIKFASNTKLHAYIQEYYAKKITSTCFLFTIININTSSTLLFAKLSITKIFIFAIACIETIFTKQSLLSKATSQIPSLASKTSSILSSTSLST